MKLKSFIIASVIIHVVGAIALYFYYNPISLAPEPVEMLTTEQPDEESAKEQAIDKAKIKKSFFKRKKKPLLPELEAVPPPPESQPLVKNSLPEPKQPAKETKKPPVLLELEEIKEEPETQALSKGLKASPAPSLNPPAPLPVKESNSLSPLAQAPLVAKKSLKESPPPENLEDYEELEESQAVEMTKPILTEPSPLSAPEKTEDLSPSPEKRSFQQIKQKMGNPPLSYPDFARRKQMQGTVSIAFFLTAQGLVEQIQLESSSGHPELDNFVIRTLARYEFFPGQEGWIHHSVPFILKGEEVERLRLRTRPEEGQSLPDDINSEQ